MNTDKPVVLFSGAAVFRMHQTGETASVIAIKHPVLGTTRVHTSLVIQKFPDGSFETLNTIYVPMETKNEYPSNND